MKNYNLKQLVLITISDFTKSYDYQYLYKTNAEPIRNLFRKKENKKFIQGWYNTSFLADRVYYMNPDDIPSKKHIIKEGQCFEKPSITIYFNSNISFEKHFETFDEVKAFSDHVKRLAESDTEYITEL